MRGRCGRWRRRNDSAPVVRRQDGETGCAPATDGHAGDDLTHRKNCGARRPRGPQKVVVAAVTAASGAAARACATNEPQASNCCECAKERAGSGYGHRCTTRKFQEVFSRQELRIHGTLAPGGYSSCCARLRWQHHHASGSLQVTCIGSCNDKANSSDGLKKRTEHNREPRQARNAAAITTRVGKGTNSKQKTTSRI